MKPLISVIIPTYNNADTIAIAIESMQKQTYSNLEIIVVDDNSTDDTYEVVRKITEKDSRITLIKSNFIDVDRYSECLKRNINAGYSARNAGFEVCKGEYITFQDADDASFLNRIDVQYTLLINNNADHITLDCVRFEDKLVGKMFNISKFENETNIVKITPNELHKLSQKTKGIVAKISKGVNSKVPFWLKRKRVINKFFFGTLESYPGAGNSPLFKRAIIEKVRFRPLSRRVWPSFMGRGADRDFNFQVAETFKNSYVFSIPLYLWRQNRQNERYLAGIEKYTL